MRFPTLIAALLLGACASAPAGSPELAPGAVPLKLSPGVAWVLAR